MGRVMRERVSRDMRPAILCMLEGTFSLDAAEIQIHNAFEYDIL